MYIIATMHVWVYLQFTIAAVRHLDYVTRVIYSKSQEELINNWYQTQDIKQHFAQWNVLQVLDWQTK
jgi:hypothetical protein